jgi:hypothetical protein
VEQPHEGIVPPAAGWDDYAEMEGSVVSRGLGWRLRRIGLLVGMSLASVNIWTGSPLMALWVGSRVQASSGPPSLGAIGVLAVVMGAISLGLIQLLGLMQAAYDRLTGRRRAVRRTLPWMRSMRGERPHEQPEGVRPSPSELMLIVCVVIAVIAFEVWFFFFSSSPIDQRSGRD